MASSDEPQVASEREPLLQPDQTIHKRNDETPLNMRMIGLLAFLRFTEPLNFSIILPFVNAMVHQQGVPLQDVGFWVGFVESVFSLTSVLSFIPTGRISDRLGRRYVLSATLSAAGAFAIAFGFSTSLAQMLWFRGLSGFFSGSTTILRTLFAEFSDPSNSARAFSYFAFAGNISLMFGTAVGGQLAEPYGRLTNITLFRTYPFALPCILAGSGTILGGIACFLYLEEPPHNQHNSPKATALRQVLNPAILRVLLAQGFINLYGFFYTALFPLWLYIPVRMGGLSMSVAQIGGIMCLGTLSQAIWLLALMPKLDAKLGTRTVLAYCFYAYPVFFCSPLLCNWFARRDLFPVVWLIIVFTSTVGAGVATSFTSYQLLLNQHAEPGTLSTINGISLTCSATLRTIAPPAITSLFSAGLKMNAGWLAWVAMVLLSLLGILSVPLLPHPAKRQDPKLVD